MAALRLLFWRTFYWVINPIRRLYWRIALPKTRGVKCLIEHDGKVLLVRLTYAHKQWTFPGGKVEKRESFKEGAFRELYEETGIRPAELSFFAEYESNKEYKRDTIQCFLGYAEKSDIKFDPLEIAEAGWFARGVFPADCQPHVYKIMEFYEKRNSLN